MVFPVPVKRFPFVPGPNPNRTFPLNVQLVMVAVPVLLTRNCELKVAPVMAAVPPTMLTLALKTPLPVIDPPAVTVVVLPTVPLPV